MTSRIHNLMTASVIGLIATLAVMPAQAQDAAATATLAPGYTYAQPATYTYAQPAATYTYAQPATTYTYAQPATTYAQPTTYTYAQPATYTYGSYYAAPATTYAAAPAAGYSGGDAYGFVNWLNGVRAQYGLAPVSYDPSLESSAAVNSAQQNARGLGHYSMGGATRQNSAMGSISTIGNQWLNSPAHRSAMLDPSIRWIGLAGAGAYWTLNMR